MHPIGTKLLYYVAGVKRGMKLGHTAHPCEIIGHEPDGRYRVMRDGRVTRVGASTLAKDYVVKPS